MSGSARNRTAHARALSTPTGRDLRDLFDSLTARLPWRLNDRPFPLVVLEPEDDRVDTNELLGALEDAAREAAIPAVSPQLGTDGARLPAISLLDTLSTGGIWSTARVQFGRYRFPRSDLVRSFEEAAAEARGDDSAARPPHQLASAAVDAWNASATPLPGRRPVQFPASLQALGVLVAGILSVLAGGIAAQTSRLILAAIAAMVAAPLLLLTVLTTRRIWLPVASRLGGRFRWFAASSFFAVIGGGEGFDGRLRRVFEGLAAPNAAEFLLQMKTFAFLEDLRDGHRKLSPTLRGLKRSVPPVVFLRGITAENGGVALVSAMSDIRSRRSEFHPLLVVASADSLHRRDLSELPETPEPPGDRARPPSPRELHAAWEAALSTAQAPSQNVALPWLLRLPIGDEPPGDERVPALTVRRRPRWTWLWSLRSLVAAVLLVAVTGTYVQTRLRDTYCGVGYPFSWNTDTRWRIGAHGSRECVGVATSGVRFERRAESISLDGELRRPSTANRGGRITLADLQTRIEAENARVLRGRQPYVTIVHASILTAASGRDALAVNGVKELAGAYLAQMRNNGTGLPGQVGNPMKIRLLAANVGQDMAFSDEAIDRILDIADRDRTVIGVTGMGRDTQNSRQAVRRLSDAGLAVIGTVNSSDALPAVANFFGLASTNREQAAALTPAVRREFGGRRIDRALFVSRDRGPSLDAYSAELAADAESALNPRRSDHVVYLGTDDITSKVKAACDNAGSRPYRLVYFAGRGEDLPGLLNGLSAGGCAERPLTLLAGDEVATVRFGADPREVPLSSSLTLYYTAFAYLPNLIAGDGDLQNGFFLLANNVLGIGGPRVAPDEPLFVDAQMALAYDAVSAFAEASQNVHGRLGLAGPRRTQVPGSATVTSGNVLLELDNLYVRQAATGDIDFSADRHVPNGTGNRGLTLVRVALKDGVPVSTPICGRLGGGRPLPRLPACPAVGGGNS